MSVAECIPSSKILSPPRELTVAHRIEPLRDARWDEFVERHPDSSLFHSSAWLRALQRTYGYKPVAFSTSSRGSRLQNALVFCQVESWLTGRRLVSLPFSDHCDPLVDRPDEMDALSLALDLEFHRGKWRYIELRPVQRPGLTLDLPHSEIPYTLHQLDLSPDVETLFRNCHKDSTQRKIRRAEREGLTYREASSHDAASEELLDYFYALHTVTRGRHARPPQPRHWFRNLMEEFGPALAIRVAFHEKRPVASILTIRHKDTLVYKYGGSDPRFNPLGSMHLLLWGAIRDARAAGLRCFDFGRTEADQAGLITFKKRWGSVQSELMYSRYGSPESVSEVFESGESWKSRLAKGILAHMPPSVLSLAGRALYRHVG